MMGLLVRFIGTSFALLLITKYLPGFTVDTLYTALIVSVVLGVLNVTLKPILMLLTLPLNLITLGLFSFVINAVLLLIIAAVIPGFHIAGFVPALVAAVILAVVGWLLHRVI